MPDLKLGLNDKLEDNSITFHPCVNLGRFSTERVGCSPQLPRLQMIPA